MISATFNNIWVLLAYITAWTCGVFKITLPNTDQAHDKISVNHFE